MPCVLCPREAIHKCLVLVTEMADCSML
uniref:Uncharacterized protein n=1 Tax=Musa acuminata subsp. malaccensis TaxID=214687 RepID=A0A804JT20_MUSAM